MTTSSTPPPAKPRSLEPKFWGSFLTSVLLAATLSVGPYWLGGFRLFIMLPIIGVIGALVIFQGFRLIYRGPSLVGRFGDSVDTSIALFLIYAALRYLTAPVEFLARVEVLQIGCYASVFWICRYGFSRRPHALYLLGALVVAGLIVTVTGFLFQYRPELRPFAPELFELYKSRQCGTYGCPNHYGEFLVMTLGILLAFCLFYRSKWILRIIGFYLAGMMCVGIALSFSRGSWLALATSLLVMAFFLVRHGKLRWYWVVGGLALLVAAAAAFLSFSFIAQTRLEEVTQYFKAQNWGGYIRITLARDALKIWNDYPLCGSGPATFLHMHQRYQDAYYHTLAEYTHNDYLNLLSDYGLVGAAIVLAFIVTVTRQLFRNLGPLPDADEAILVASGLCAWCAMLVHATVDFNLHIPANAYVFFALIGLGLRRSAATADVNPGWLPKSTLARPTGILIILFGGLLLAASIYSTRGYYPYYLANRNYTNRPVPAAFIGGHKAVAADPKSFINLRYLADLYRNRAAAETDFTKRAADAQTAADLYARAVIANPLHDELLAFEGVSYDLMGRYAEAYLIHSAAIKNQPYNGVFRLFLGLHFWRRNMLPEAQKAFEVGAKCPHGNAENIKALNEINRILGERKIQEQLPVPEHPPTIP